MIGRSVMLDAGKANENDSNAKSRNTEKKKTFRLDLNKIGFDLIVYFSLDRSTRLKSGPFG